jgi:hypothetical protein
MRALICLLLVAACDMQGEARPADPRRAPSTQMPPGHPPMGMPPPEVSGEVLLRGTIAVAPNLADKLPASATLFLTARAAEQGTAGPPVLVKRMDVGAFPMSFELGTQNMMMQGMAVPSDFVVQARLDQDGDAISRLPGDLAGVTKQAVKRGNNAVSITLDEVVIEFKPGRQIQ